MSGESIKRLRAEPKNYNLNRNYTVKRQRSDSVHYKRRTRDYGVQTTIIDSGACNIKYGTTNMQSPHVMPNCIIKAKAERKRPFIGNQIEDCRDLSGLYYLLPCERGYVTKWDVQKPIWDYIFQKNSIEDHSVIMTQPLFNFRSIQECMDEIMFEEYDVQSLVRANPTDLAYYNHIQSDTNDLTPPCIVVDSGFSFTHIVPYLEGKKYFNNIIRIDIGGKLLTNYMKDIISYRQLHVMEETYVINQVKEDACFISQNLRADMRIAQQTGSKNSIIRNYVLPDFNNIRRGYIQEPGSSLNEIAEGCQILRLNNERFTVPELLLNPSNIGMECMGIAEAIAKCIKSCPLKYQASLAQNIVLIGGNANFPGYRERIYADVRSMLPYYLPLGINKPEDPITYAWKGGKVLSKSPQFDKLVVVKHEYEEYGSNITNKRFNNMINNIIEDEIPEETTKKYSLLSNINGRSIFGKHDIEEEQQAQAAETAATISQEEVEEIKAETIINEDKIETTDIEVGEETVISEDIGNDCEVLIKNGVKDHVQINQPVVTLEDIIKVAGKKDFKICSAPGLSIPIQSTQNIMRFITPNNNSTVKQVVRIHYPQAPTIVKNIAVNQTAQKVISAPSILRLPLSRTQSLNGQQITILQNKPILTHLPMSSAGNVNQILRLNYTVPKAKVPQVSDTVRYTAVPQESKDKTVVLVKQVFLKKN